MADNYNIFFVPEFKDRKKLSPLRSKICKDARSTGALLFPLHMSLISGSFTTKKINELEKDLRELCNKEPQIILHCPKKSSMNPSHFWTGINIKPSRDIKPFQIKLQKIRDKYADKKGIHLFKPLHITFAYPARVGHLKPITLPIRKLVFDQITLVKRNNETGSYKIYKKIKLAN